MGLIITHRDPDEIRSKYNLKSTSIIWITDSETENYSVGSHDMEQLIETIFNFVKNHPDSCILLDDISYLTSQDGFQKMSYFLKTIKKELESSSIIIPAGEITLDRKQRYILEREFTFIPSRGYLFEMKHISEFDLKKIRYVLLDYNPISRSILHEFILRNIKSTIVSEKHVDTYLKDLAEHVHSNPLNKYALQKLDLDHENVIIIPTFEFDPDTILAINLIREITEKAKILAKINKEKFIEVAKRAGANEVIPASTIGGKLISLALSSPNIVEWIMDAITYKTTEVELMEYDIEKNSRFKGKTIDYLGKTFKGIINVIAVRQEKEFIQIPDTKYILKQGDKIIFATNLDKLEKHKELSSILKKKIKSPIHRRHK